VASDIEIQPFRAEDGDAWDRIVRAATPTHFMFERAYLDYHGDRFEDASLIVVKGNAVQAVIPAAQIGDRIVSHPGLTFGTVIGAGPPGMGSMLAMLTAARDHFADQGASEWEVRPLPSIYHGAAGDADICALTLLGGAVSRRDIATAIAPGQRHALSTERRRALKRGAASGLVVQVESGIEEFMTLLAGVLANRHDTVPVHSTEEVTLLMQRFPTNIRLMTARAPDGTMHAGMLLFETDTVCHAQYIAASDEARANGGLDVLADRAITEAGAAGKWFDFGTSNERSGKVNWGLVRNKEGFGGRSVAYDRYSLSLGNDHLRKGS
jgi:hypothetical protein